MSSVRWFDRSFELVPEASLFPTILERLRGTPARVAEKVKQIPSPHLTRRVDDGWSIQENLGHLLDLEPLWDGRLDDLLNGAEALRPADLTNRATREANHNEKSIDDLVAAFRDRPQKLIRRLDALTPGQVVAESAHPRLKQPMRTIDLCLFVAEHDDHHLARMTALARSGLSFSRP